MMMDSDTPIALPQESGKVANPRRFARLIGKTEQTKSQKTTAHLSRYTPNKAMEETHWGASRYDGDLDAPHHDGINKGIRRLQ